MSSSLYTLPGSLPAKGQNIVIDRMPDARAKQAGDENAILDDRLDGDLSQAETLEENAHSARGADEDDSEAEQLPAYRGELRPALDLAARWLWRDGRPRAVIGRRRAVLWCNPAARRLLVAPVPLVIRNNHLCPAKGIDIAPVDAFLERLSSASTRLQVMDAETDRGVLLTAWADIVDGQQAAFIEFGLRELPFDCRESGMAAAFGLTKAECRIVDALAVMEAPSKIAERLGVSVHTVRTHIRRIYAKMKVRSQLHFMRLTMAYCGG